ncbi:hypothetical protein BY458DRAFT_500210 [Sporodiniella umbellata]|nr:hypothetical protein BY458DRAFT_500210 [Sporodiniella umbellata]
MPKYPVTVSIDFGTTFSGCCFCLTKDSDWNIQVVSQWPKCHGFYAKAPTFLYYRNKNGRLMDWGKGARLLSFKPNQDGTLLQYFKLALIQEDIPLPQNKTAVDIISDYLRIFHEHVVERIQRTKGFESYRAEEYQYCLTVPAIWPDQAKASMRKSAIQAGIIHESDPLERLELISEPEAAAAYCDHRYRSLSLGNGDLFMIVDAGGGTVDLVTYIIEDETPPRTLREVTKGHGGTCGSAFIDQNMRRLLTLVLGDTGKDMPVCVFESMMDTFIEKIKPNYRGDEEHYVMEVPAAALPYIDNDLLNENECMIFDRNDLENRVFAPVLNQTLDLVNDQLEKAGGYVNAIFLVGGFGSSTHLYEELKKKFDTNVVGEIAMPPRGELAVAEGAIYYALSPDLVTTKILRRSYGVKAHLLFRQGIDPESSAVFTSDGQKRCSTRFEAIAKKGRSIRVDDKIAKTYWVEYPNHTKVSLYSSDEDTVPRYVTDQGVSEVVEFPIKMPFQPDVQPGEKVSVNVEFTFGATEVRITVRIADIVNEHTLESVRFYS